MESLASCEPFRVSILVVESCKIRACMEVLSMEEVSREGKLRKCSAGRSQFVIRSVMSEGLQGRILLQRRGPTLSTSPYKSR